ncbi:MAG: ASCH domain-containing protein [Opitutaceae bacterium]
MDKVEDGRKTQTIRADRKVPIKVGDWLFLFTGMRQPRCRRLSPPIRCIQTIKVSISSDAAGLVSIIMGDRGELGAMDMQALAALDGFDCLDDFIDFFAPKPGSNFNGQIIRWKWWGEPVDATNPRIRKPSTNH